MLVILFAIIEFGADGSSFVEFVDKRNTDVQRFACGVLKAYKRDNFRVRKILLYFL